MAHVFPLSSLQSSPPRLPPEKWQLRLLPTFQKNIIFAVSTKRSGLSLHLKFLDIYHIYHIYIIIMTTHLVMVELN